MLMKPARFRPLSVVLTVLLALPPASTAATATAAAPAAAETGKRIGASGRITPDGGIVSLGGTPGAVVREVRTRPGDRVTAGTVLMVLGGDAVDAPVRQAQADVDAARERGQAERSAGRLAAEAAGVRLAEASRQVRSYAALSSSAAARNEQLRLQAAEKAAALALRQAQAEARARDVEAAHRDDLARQALQLAREAQSLRAPVDATVLRIDKGVGQSLGDAPALHLGNLSTMWVVADIYEGDLLRLREGLHATIRHTALRGDLTGTVDGISRLIDPRSRLAQVRIRLADDESLRRLVGLEVDVVIDAD